MSSHATRYIPHGSPPDVSEARAKEDILDALDAGTRRVHRHRPSKEGVYVGAAGILLMDWHIASIPDIQEHLSSHISSPTSLTLPSDGGHASFLETSVGPATIHLTAHMRATVRSDADDSVSPDIWHPCVNRIDHDLKVSVAEPLDDDGCEVLYGRAGLLYAILRLRSEVSHCPESHDGQPSIILAVRGLTSDTDISALVQDIVQRGQLGAQEYSATLSEEDKKRTPPLMWRWHGRRYLGGAHGLVGILQMLVSVPPRPLEPHWNLILGTVRWLLAVQLPSGNWPSKASTHMHSVEAEDEKYQLIQWCHGAPAVLIFLCKILRLNHGSSPVTIPDTLAQSTQIALIRGGELVYNRGLLRKSVGLCHGVAGSVYALLAISSVLDSDSAEHQGMWLKRAVHLALLATTYREMEGSGEMRVPDRPYSLYEGVAGMCCAWADVWRLLAGEKMGGMPGYDDLHDVD
ncbi:hypothetical protein EUX98_g7298 [Antrodiella citrinella]|uniref:Uncharacterized protein n=1 Tax=Antrodiella citrinella TaxID=2447956 RepID=A0A4S4MM62_9APHY|nr:hypothetical protein EUX98_g7298 [Antrodiella citrinella]